MSGSRGTAVRDDDEEIRRRALRVRALEADVAEQLGGYRDRMIVYIPEDAERRLPIYAFRTPPAGKLVFYECSGYELHDGSPAPRFVRGPGYASDPQHGQLLLTEMLDRGWISSHRTSLAGGRPNVVFSFLHVRRHVCVDGIGEDLWEAMCHAALDAAKEDAGSAPPFPGALVDRRVLEMVPANQLDPLLATVFTEVPDGVSITAAVTAVDQEGGTALLVIPQLDGTWSVASVTDTPLEQLRDPIKAIHAALCSAGIDSRPDLVPMIVMDRGVVTVFDSASEAAEHEANYSVMQWGEPVVLSCTICGCSEWNACPPRCAWIQIDHRSGAGVCDAPVCRAIHEAAGALEPVYLVARATKDVGGLPCPSATLHAGRWYIVRAALPVGTRLPAPVPLAHVVITNGLPGQEDAPVGYETEAEAAAVLARAKMLGL